MNTAQLFSLNAIQDISNGSFSYMDYTLTNHQIGIAIVKAFIWIEILKNMYKHKQQNIQQQYFTIYDEHNPQWNIQLTKDHYEYQ